MRISFPFGPQSIELLGKQCARLSACLLDKSGSTASHLNAFYAQSAFRSCTSSVPGWYLTQNASKKPHNTEQKLIETRRHVYRFPFPARSTGSQLLRESLEKLRLVFAFRRGPLHFDCCLHPKRHCPLAFLVSICPENL